MFLTRGAWKKAAASGVDARRGVREHTQHTRARATWECLLPCACQENEPEPGLGRVGLGLKPFFAAKRRLLRATPSLLPLPGRKGDKCPSEGLILPHGFGCHRGHDVGIQGVRIHLSLGGERSRGGGDLWGEAGPQGEGTQNVCVWGLTPREGQPPFLAIASSRTPPRSSSPDGV